LVRTLAATFGKNKTDVGWTFQSTAVQFPQGGAVLGVRFSHDGKFLGLTRAGGQVAICDPSTGQILRELAAGGRGAGSAEGIAFHPQLPWCVTAHKNSRVARVWNTTSAELLCELPGHEGGVMCAEFSPDGRRLATASEDLSIKVWDLSGPGVPVEPKRRKKTKLAAVTVGN
jgi:WD40 repeat protein